MRRTDALVIVILVFLVFLFICYYGIYLTLFSSVALSVILALIVLQFLYPISQVLKESGDETLIVYALLITIALIILFFYIGIKAVCDVRCIP